MDSSWSDAIEVLMGGIFRFDCKNHDLHFYRGDSQICESGGALG